ncbi:phage baseplate assembly protein V [Methylophaga sp.]|jgi:phage baseplate assembly protein V|uniref:phage baseplate assembly protein V n=1 Tax=Methylophaga sp. TaxID=2024840 RepID=UPI003A8F1579
MQIELIVSDMQRRLSNMIKRGKVHSVDFSQTPPRVKVEYEAGAITAWLPFVSSRQSIISKSKWEPLSVGEGVMVFSESGDMSLGVVFPATADGTNVPPSTSPDEHVTKYSDGSLVKYDRSSHQLTVNVVGAISVSCKSADVTASGDVTVDASQIKLNKGVGVVTGECICPFTGSPHADISTTVLAGK